MSYYLRIFAMSLLIIVGIMTSSTYSDAGITCDSFIGIRDESIYIRCYEPEGCLNHKKLARSYDFDLSEMNVKKYHMRCFSRIEVYNKDDFALPYYRNVELSESADQDSYPYEKAKFYVLWGIYATHAELIE